MTKNARKALLIRLAASRGMIAAVAGLAYVSQVEIRDTVSEVTKNKIETVEDDSQEWESSLAVDTVPDKFGEESFALSAKEKAQLRRDLEAKQLAARLPFAIVLRPNCEADLNEMAELSNFAQA